VGDFFEQRGERTCDELEAHLPDTDKEDDERNKKLAKFKVFWDGGKNDKETLTLTISQLLARAYPSKNHYEEEFVLLDSRPNRVMKEHVSCTPVERDMLADKSLDI
jgi:hypothetical protein